MFITKNLIENIKKYSLPYEENNHIRPLIEAVGEVNYALLGEATHGTSEFYTTRAELTKILIQEKGFNFIAVEGDWPACFEVNCYIKGYENSYSSAKELLQTSFNRWPSWMWANTEMIELIEWLKSYNQTQKVKVGFYGIDVYSLWESMETVIQHLEQTESPILDKAKAAFECFEPFHRKPEQYGLSAALYGEDCMEEVSKLLQSVLHNRVQYNDEDSLNLAVNTLVTSNAEHYYHTMITNDNESWNIRDHHMVEVLKYISNYYGEKAKGVVWEHNTHIGDARATDMNKEGLVNVGQLSREKFGENKVYAIGFGTYQGTVIASTKWGHSYEIMTVPEAHDESFEAYLHKANNGNCILLFDQDNKGEFNETIGHRAIGVIYHPEFEHYGNYVPSQMSERYNAFVFIDETKALSPLKFSD
ncbi:erythromycin esterase family protein [Bacillus sp. FJAT-45350]|uniref:erythromycin esterase family protein n=1 Tax=Bacillus sp. FJAT-45350 TaxID=2011014 RepID=UPI000BB87976|nr:erythromycin esterase family protein [Bacillus sp. FJAT-45350]